jgi:8-oxo-dGTP diphosphatase
MKDSDGIPVFGEPAEAERYTVRASAYALVEDERGQVAVVRTPQGFFLPGGGIEAGETAAEAIVREALEECGLIVRAGRWTIAAVQFAYSVSDRTHYEKHCTFMDARIEAAQPCGTEEDHVLVWMDPTSACEILSHASHGWAVENWTRRTTTNRDRSLLRD